jgi:3-hydroxyisobutyrate dehydrogenase-like beta-hydroxyacid dehydrogenase
MSERIGFIGLGQMGKWMALNLAKKGYQVTVSDISVEAVAFLKGQGVRSAPNPGELAGKADWIFFSLPDAAVLEQVLFGADGLASGARPGLIAVDLGTTAYMATLDFSSRLARLGVAFADAPVSGMEARAKDGALTIMFGGDEEMFTRLKPALSCLGNTVLYMGEVGCGQLTKLINQLLFNIGAAAIAEILPMAVKLGLDPEKVAQVVTTGTGRSFAVEFFAPRIMENRFSEGYALKNAYKDMISAAEICAQKMIPMPLVHAATTTYQMALAAGYGDEDKGAMIKVFERILGVQFRKKGAV